MASLNARILVVEDDEVLNQQLTELIDRAGYQVDARRDGESALLAATTRHFDLMLLDLMLPQRDGISLLRSLRKSNQMPVIIVSARGAEEERITGLRLGADDYVAKPFNPTELLLRIEALLRRSLPAAPASPDQLLIDGLNLALGENSATIDGIALELTRIQFLLLWELGLHRGEVLSKSFLSQRVLNKTLGAHDRALDMHLSRVRRKLNEMGWRGDRLISVRGEGYLFK